MSAVSTSPASTGRTSSSIRRLTTALKSSCYRYVQRSQMKTTLLPNEVHEEVSVHSSIFAASRLHCHYRPFRRDYKMDQSSAYSKTTDLWVYLQTTMWIASRLIKSMRFNTTWVVYLLLPISPQAQVSNPRGWITNIYPCNIIHEISHANCSDVWQVLSIHRAFHWFWIQGCGSVRFLMVGFITMLRH